MNSSAGTPNAYKIAIVAPTCFYYQTDLFRLLNENPDIDLKVYFLSNEGLLGKDVKIAYGIEKTWDSEDEILSGFQSKFIHNHAFRGSYLKSLVGLANFGIWKELRRDRPDAVLIMSWMNPTWWLIFLACLRFSIPMLFMTDANYYAEGRNSSWKSLLKRIILGKILFPNVSGFLCSGTANRKLYSGYGVPSNKLIPFAYSWGYRKLMDESEKLRDQRSEFRSQNGIPKDAKVILYCGRLSPEKGSMELLESYNSVSDPKKALVLVGDGRLRPRMQTYVDTHGLESVHFKGFQSRENIAKFYAMADLLVLPSRKETWGIVVNEGLCFSLPLVVSDQVGAGIDLVKPGGNGYVFPAGDVSALAASINRFLELPTESQLEMGRESYSVITEWVDRDLSLQLKEFLDGL